VRIFLPVLWILLPPAFAISGTLETAEELKAIERAHAATDEIKSNFRTILKQELSKGGPAKALPACKVEAPKITAKSSGRAEVIAVGRTSHRIRNPANTPPEWVKPYLDKFTAAKPSEIPKHVLVELNHRHYGYLEPIFVEPICLNCHGKDLGKDLREAIRKDYPGDKAVGFNVGEFRGLLWLEMNR